MNTDMIMLRWARCKTKKDHIKNEDIWREVNIERTFFRKRRLRWYGHVIGKEWKYTTKKMSNMQVQGKRRNESQEEIGGQHQGWRERVQDDERRGAESKGVACEDKGRSITTWRRPIIGGVVGMILWILWRDRSEAPWISPNKLNVRPTPNH